MLLEYLCQQVTYHYIHYFMIIDSIIIILQMETTSHATNVIGRWFCSKKFVLMVQSPVLVIHVKELPAQLSRQLFVDLIHVTNHAAPSGC